MIGDNSIRVYPNVFPDELCDKLVDLFFKYPDNVTVGQTAQGVRKKKKSLDFFMAELLEGSDEDIELHDLTVEYLEEAKRLYLRDHPYMMEAVGFKLEHECPKLKRYIKGFGNYQTHVDAGLKSHSRQLVAIAYLNDMEEGGETIFPEQGVSVKPAKGSVVLFPPFWTYPHQSAKAVSGDKFMVSTFFHGV